MDHDRLILLLIWSVTDSPPSAGDYDNRTILTRSTPIDCQVQLTPGSVLGRFSQVTDVDPQPRAIDEQMQRPMGGRADLTLIRCGLA